MKKQHNILLGVLAVGSMGLQGCVFAPMAVGAAATGAYIGLQERSVEQIAADTKVKVHIKERLTNSHYSYLADIGVTVFEGDVLLTGVVKTREEGEKILEIVRGTPDVKQVYNELFIGSGYGAGQKAKDAWISAQFTPRLIGNRQTFPINYSSDVVNGHVYVMGYVTSEQEQEHVLHILRTTKGVQQVHDYLRIAETGGDPRKKSLTEGLSLEGVEIEPAPSLPDDL